MLLSYSMQLVSSKKIPLNFLNSRFYFFFSLENTSREIPKSSLFRFVGIYI